MNIVKSVRRENNEDWSNYVQWLWHVWSFQGNVEIDYYGDLKALADFFKICYLAGCAGEQAVALAERLFRRPTFGPGTTLGPVIEQFQAFQQCFYEEVL